MSSRSSRGCSRGRLPLLRIMILTLSLSARICEGGGMSYSPVTATGRDRAGGVLGRRGGAAAGGPLPSSSSYYRTGRGPPTGYVPPTPPPSAQEEAPRTSSAAPAQPPQQQQQAGVVTRPWGPASSTYTYQRYYSSQPAGATDRPDLLYPRIMRTVGNTGVCILFMILTARATHLYELADQISGALRRYGVIIPVVGLLFANLVGVLFSLVQSFSRNSRLKTRLKAILTLNGVAEMTMILYNMLRLVLGNDLWTPREAYVGRLFTSIWMLTIIYAFATSRWQTDTS